MSKDEKKYFKIAKWMESTIQYADALIAVSEKLKLEVLQNYPVKEEKISYIPNGVDPSVFKPENIPQEDKKILYVGRFSLEKGIDLVPKIIKKVFEKNHEVKFEIVAPDINIPRSLEKIKREFENLIEQYPNRFIWHRESLSREELAKLYNECLIYIQPSRYEAFGLVLLEAMASGLPCIAFQPDSKKIITASDEIIINGKTGFLVKDEKEMAEKIDFLFSDDKLRKKMSLVAIKRAKEFSSEKMMKKFLFTIQSKNHQ